MIFLLQKGLCRLACASLVGLLPGLRAQTPAPPEQPAAAPAPVPLSKVSPLGQAPDWNLLAAFDGRLSREAFDRAWADLYSSHSVFPAHFRVEEDGVVIPTGQAAKPEIKIAFQKPGGQPSSNAPRYWRRAGELPPLNGRPVLSDLKIALDPGHIGGVYARMEERYLSFRPGESIQEGDMSLLTAQVLAERLRALGATVTLVRDKLEPVTERRPKDFEPVAAQILKEAGITEPKLTYEAGMTDSAKGLTVQWQEEKLFYRVSEIHARGAKVNGQIKPDLVLCLHFNAEPWGPDGARQFSGRNHFHALVNGCYSPGELEQQDVRFEMFSRIFQGINLEEAPLADAIAEGMAKRTGLPPYIYTTPNARRVGANPYVYARNLLANRIYQCPVVYLEPYVMNHEETYRRLLLGHYVGRTLVAGRLQTSAIEDYVRGIVDGLVAYYQSQNRPS